MNASKYYFFKTVRIEGRPRLRPLPGQLLDGVQIDPSLNVQADSVMRGISLACASLFPSSSPEGPLQDSTADYQ